MRGSGNGYVPYGRRQHRVTLRSAARPPTGLPRDTPAPRVPGCVPKNPKKKPEDSSLALSQELKPANTVPLLSSTQVPSISFIRADRHLNTTALLAKHLCSPWTNQLPFTNCWQDQHCRRELPVFHQDPTKLGFRQGSTAFASVTKPGSQGIGADSRSLLLPGRER